MTQLALFTLALLASAGHAASCRFGADRRCMITGHCEVRKTKTYLIACEKEERQIEVQEGARFAAFLDRTTRATLDTCEIGRAEFARLKREYQRKSLELENPRCYLTQWKGQMMFVAAGAKVRCSFRMNTRRAQEFKNKTGITPLYQCEKDYFLAAGDKAAPAQVFKRVKDRWKLECLATMRVGDPVEDVDWNNPPAYYEPERDASGPKSGSAAISRLDQMTDY